MSVSPIAGWCKLLPGRACQYPQCGCAAREQRRLYMMGHYAHAPVITLASDEWLPEEPTRWRFGDPLPDTPLVDCRCLTPAQLEQVCDQIVTDAQEREVVERDYRVTMEALRRELVKACEESINQEFRKLFRQPDDDERARSWKDAGLET